jgi:hypothetical protein
MGATGPQGIQGPIGLKIDPEKIYRATINTTEIEVEGSFGMNDISRNVQY